ncbi:MAG: 23S rRNA (pseudouridine(1915)-N(3))-methyltransferase RlmH [Oscillospiraceae bacterium]
MLTVTVICIGKLKEKYLSDACSEYQKRLSAFCKLNVVELAEYKLPDNPSDAQISGCIQKEGESILGKIAKDACVIPLCIEGKSFSSPELAQKIEGVALGGCSSIAFVIGGSYGLSDRVKSVGKFSLSMSKMTFPHQVARVMLLEQIYRCFQILSHGKYHK